MAREEDAGHFEWVNTWASAPATTMDTAVAAPPAEPKPVVKPAAVAAKPAAPAAVVSAPHKPAEPDLLPADQLMRDIAEIEKVRDALDNTGALTQRIRAFTLVSPPAKRVAPLIIAGGVAFGLLSVFGAAAAVFVR